MPIIRYYKWRKHRKTKVDPYVNYLLKRKKYGKGHPKAGERMFKVLLPATRKLKKGEDPSFKELQETIPVYQSDPKSVNQLLQTVAGTEKYKHTKAIGFAYAPHRQGRLSKMFFPPVGPPEGFSVAAQTPVNDKMDFYEHDRNSETGFSHRKIKVKDFFPSAHLKAQLQRFGFRATGLTKKELWKKYTSKEFMTAAAIHERRHLARFAMSKKREKKYFKHSLPYMYAAQVLGKSKGAQKKYKEMARDRDIIDNIGYRGGHVPEELVADSHIDPDNVDIQHFQAKADFLKARKEGRIKEDWPGSRLELIKRIKMSRRLTKRQRRHQLDLKAKDKKLRNDWTVQALRREVHDRRKKWGFWNEVMASVYEDELHKWEWKQTRRFRKAGFTRKHNLGVWKAARQTAIDKGKTAPSFKEWKEKKKSGDKRWKKSPMKKMTESLDDVLFAIKDKRKREAALKIRKRNSKKRFEPWPFKKQRRKHFDAKKQRKWKK